MANPVAPGKIGVVTVLYQSAPMLPEFFASLAAQTHRDFQLFAVDNASTDDSLALCSALGGQCAVIANEENDGVAAANNQGIAAALADGCEYVLLLNNDVRFGPDLFVQLLAGIHTEHCQMTTPLMLYYSAPETIWCAGGGFQHWLGERPRHFAQDQRDTGQSPSRPVEFTPTCCALIHRSVFARIGVMDERYFLYWDDTDFMLRAHRAGVRLCLIPNARLWHHVGALAASEFTLRYATRNHAYYLRKHLAAPLAALWCALYATVFALGAPFSRRRRVQLRAWLDGCRMPLNPAR
jgi:GT2 family glycosyltransferase